MNNPNMPKAFGNMTKPFKYAITFGDIKKLSLPKCRNPFVMDLLTVGGMSNVCNLLLQRYIRAGGATWVFDKGHSSNQLGSEMAEKYQLVIKKPYSPGCAKGQVNDA